MINPALYSLPSRWLHPHCPVCDGTGEAAEPGRYPDWDGCIACTYWVYGAPCRTTEAVVTALAIYADDDLEVNALIREAHGLEEDDASRHSGRAPVSLSLRSRRPTAEEAILDAAKETDR